MHKRSNSNSPGGLSSYRKKRIMEALRALEAKGLIYSKLCPDGKVRFFAGNRAALKQPPGSKELN
jgi:hypothetical protein